MLNSVDKVNSQYDQSNKSLFKIKIRWDKYIGTQVPISNHDSITYK